MADDGFFFFTRCSVIQLKVTNVCQSPLVIVGWKVFVRGEKYD